ncbi:MAG: hypothetical protein IT320_21235 [Anaerolineae bacterium]|nr:hypothetical protein [Anaerolineae bacterium]
MSGDFVSVHHHNAPHARDMFEPIWRRGHLERLIASIRHQPRLISLLADRYQETQVPSSQRATHKPVRLERIVGTAGSLDFDRCAGKTARWIARPARASSDAPPNRVNYPHNPLTLLTS